jgi:hypothetical protein
MIKKIYLLLFVAVIFAACSNHQKPVENEITEQEKVVTELTVANFEKMAGDLVGEEIIIKGLVNHTCKHGGKRMFIVAEDTEESVKIEAGENIDSFDAELEGSDVIVKGLVEELRVDEAYLTEWEAEVEADAESELKIHDGDHEGEHSEGEEEAEGEEGETEEDHHGSDLEQIENLRKQLKESGKDHLSFFSIKCLSYEVASTPPPTAE